MSAPSAPTPDLAVDEEDLNDEEGFPEDIEETDEDVPGPEDD